MNRKLFRSSVLVCLCAIALLIPLLIGSQQPSYSYSHPVIVEDLLNPNGTAVLQSVRGCLPPTPDSYEYPYRFSLLGRIDDPQAASDPNPERPLAYLYVNVFDTPNPDSDYVPWQTLIGLRRDRTCQNYIGQDAFVSLTNYMPPALAIEAADMLYRYREQLSGDSVAYREKLRRAYGEGVAPDVVAYPETPDDQRQLDVEPCELVPEWAAVVRSRGIFINPEVCAVQPIPRYPFWARPSR